MNASKGQADGYGNAVREGGEQGVDLVEALVVDQDMGWDMAHL